jgi:hypothetical protein
MIHSESFSSPKVKTVSRVVGWGFVRKIGLFLLPHLSRIFSTENPCEAETCFHMCQKRPDILRILWNLTPKVTWKICINFQPPCIHQPSDFAYNTPIDSAQCAHHPVASLRDFYHQTAVLSSQPRAASRHKRDLWSRSSKRDRLHFLLETPKHGVIIDARDHITKRFGPFRSEIGSPNRKWCKSKMHRK